MRRWTKWLMVGWLMAAGAARGQTLSVWIDSHTNVYLVANGLTNQIVSIVQIPTNLVASQCADYPVTTNNALDYDPTRPTQNELGYTLGCALVQLKQDLLAWMGVSMTVSGTLQNGIIGSNTIGVASVDPTNLAPVVQQKLNLLNAGAVTPLLVSNAMYYVAGHENTYSAVETRSVETTLLGAAFTVPSNGLARVLIEADIGFYNDTGGSVRFTAVNVYVNGAQVKSYGESGEGYDIANNSVGSLFAQAYVSGGTLANGGTIDIKATSDNGSVNTKILTTVKSLRVLGMSP